MNNEISILYYRWVNLTKQHNNQRIAYFPTKRGTIWLITFDFDCFLPFYCFHKDCHESPGCSTAPAGSRPLHICEYVATAIL